MMPESLINSPLLAGLAITLIHFLWQGALVALVLKALLSVISHQKSQLRYALSSMAMLANLLLPVMTFFVVYDIEYRQTANLMYALPLLEQNFYLEQIQAHAWYMPWLEYLPVLAMTWLTIVLTLAVKLIIELRHVNKLPLQGCSLADSALQSRFDQLTLKLGLAKKVTLLVTHKSHIPMALGWLKPVVLLPFSMISGLSPQQLDMLLLHELAHIRRHDYLVNFLQTLVEILLFFHPAVRWVSKQMRNEREYCSDDIAVQHSSGSLAYAHTLADTASLCQKHRRNSIPNMAMAASGGDLKQRIVRLLEQQQHCTKTSDSGKWLASFSILLIMLMAFFQQAITLPIIDLQSGNIALFSPAKAPSRSAVQHPGLAFEQRQAPASFARQLLAMSSAKASAKAQVESELHTDSKKLDEINRQQSPAYDNELAITGMALPVAKNIAQHQAELRDQMLDSTYSATKKTKTTADFAFERADSPEIETVITNIYSQPFTSLLSKAAQSSQLTRLSHAHSNHRDVQRGVGGFAENTHFKTAYTPAQLLSSTEPRYPSSALRKAIELDVVVEFNIDKNGLVTDINFESKSKVNYFRNAIRSAMEKWRFLPAQENGQAIASNMTKIFSFSLLK